MRATKARSDSRKIMLGVSLAVLIAVGIAVLVHMLRAVPTYAIDAHNVLLTQDDVGLGFASVGEGSVGPAQRTLNPLPYQQQLLSGRLREFMSASVLSPAGRKEIADWESQYGLRPTNPPAIMGSFVADHTGVFDIDNVVRSFQTIDAAKQEFHCCNYDDRANNFDDYHVLPVQLGDEADAWTGIQKTVSGPGIAADIPKSGSLQERGYSIHWRRGPVVAIIATWGAHDITLDDALRLARLVDNHIVQALQQSTQESFHAGRIACVSDSTERALARTPPLCVADRRARADVRRDRPS